MKVAVRGERVLLWCPGCDSLHQISIDSVSGWTWDGNLEGPTVEPSILVTAPPLPMRCHSFLRNGQWDFLGDSTHALAGQKVPMVDLPAWVLQ